MQDLGAFGVEDFGGDVGVLFADGGFVFMEAFSRLAEDGEVDVADEIGVGSGIRRVMAGDEDEGADVIDEEGGRFAIAEHLACETSARCFVVGCLRVVDDIVEPKGDFGGSGGLDEVADALELGQALTQVAQIVVVAVRFGIGA